MRKFTLFFASMLVGMGAWAQEVVWPTHAKTAEIGEKITDFSTIADEATVAFKIVSQNKWLTITTDQCKAVMKNEATGLSIFKLHRDGEENDRFTIESARAGYYFPSIVNAGWPGYYMTNENQQVFQFLSSKQDGTALAEGQFTVKDITTAAYFDGSATDFTGWQGNGDNCVYEVYIVSPGEEMNIFSTIAYTLTDVAGNTYEGTYEGFLGQSEPTLEGVQGCTTFSNMSWNEEGTKVAATVNFPFPVSSEDVTNEMMLTIFNTGKKWHAIGTDIKVQTAAVAEPSEEDIEDWQWAIYPSLADGVFTFTIKNIATGKYVYTESTGDALNTQGTMTLQETGTPFEIVAYSGAFAFKKPGENVYISINSTNDTDVYLGTYHSLHGGVVINTIVEVEEITITANGEYYVELLKKNATVQLTATINPTLATDKTLTWSSDNALVTVDQNGLVTLVDYCNEITWVTITATASNGVTGTFGINVYAPAPLEPGAVTNIMITPTYKELTVKSGETFQLTAEVNEDATDKTLTWSSNNTEVATVDQNGLVTFVGNDISEEPIAITATASNGVTATCYLTVTINGSIDTAIESVEAEGETVIYDIHGRRVEKMEKGIYIVNGKKVLVK